ncbi:hypothetical protein C5Y96_24405 [Blastopirellula marina]|uniref:Carboxypeptidase regulatory-like domain-containing protein n=1 Tax=Blastopirellula marina TaxID=124 RepID=A0A2S8EZZ1_9BACT|nr:MULTISPECIES: carboxypeptidase-like regulatory domain-containing protein [Pirellulaceae]PQO25486.1 hypothetical protein C5Y96_24405 [Blastopirellula marina]RCS42450.1 carboxypeptidase regulatory-like domain-containing protein [Bremerella cremea]
MRRISDASKVLLMAAVACALLAGCSGKRDDKWTRGRPPVYEVTGQVTYQGKPVADAVLTFQPVDETGKGGSAITDDQGYFEAQTFDPGDGLTPGTHRVAVHKVQLVDASGNVVTEIREPGGLREKNLVPKKYADFKKSGIEIKVEEDDNDVGVIELVD